MKYDTLLSMLPDVIKKDHIIEQSRIVRTELADSTIPVFINAKGLFTVDQLKSTRTQNLQKTYEKITHKRTSIIDDICESISNLNENLNVLEDIVNKNFQNEIIKASISIRELNVIQFIGISHFVSSYSRKLLALFYTGESSEFVGTSLKFNESISKAELKYITDNFLDFVNSLNALTVRTDNLEKILKSLPEVNVNRENINSIAAIQSNSKVDPLKLQYFNITNTFIYTLQLKWAEFMADRYKIAQEEKKMLEYRNLLLKRQREGQSDALLEKEIAVNEDRIAKLTYRIRKHEEDVQ